MPWTQQQLDAVEAAIAATLRGEDRAAEIIRGVTGIGRR